MEGNKLENVLTISATEYVAMCGKQLGDYLPKGIQVCYFAPYQPKREGIEKHFLTAIPTDAEVVVGYKAEISDHSYYLTGTALIPKK